MNPLFSIITVTYNAAKTLPATLASVAGQTCDLYEYIVIDGASTDDSVLLAEQAPIARKTIISERDRGLYDAMNKGLGIANGDYVIFLNAGDSFAGPGTLQTIADTILDNDYPGIVYGQTDLVDDSRRVIGQRHLTAPENLTLESFAQGMLVCHQAFVALRKITGNFNLHYRFSADYEWCVRCLQHSRRNVYIPEVIIHYLAEGTTTANHRASLWERFRIMCRYYGTIPTVGRHLHFLTRFLRRRRSASANCQ